MGASFFLSFSCEVILSPILSKGCPEVPSFFLGWLEQQKRPIRKKKHVSFFSTGKKYTKAFWQVSVAMDTCFGKILSNFLFWGDLKGLWFLFVQKRYHEEALSLNKGALFLLPLSSTLASPFFLSLLKGGNKNLQDRLGFFQASKSYPICAEWDWNIYLHLYTINLSYECR